MHSLHSAARAFACLLVCYALVVALFAPLAARKATAAPPPVKATTSPQPPAVQAKKKAARKARELVVRFKSTTPESERQQLLAFKGARRLKKLKGKSRSERIEVPAAADLEALAAELKALPQVELAEPNYLLTKEDLTPDDARFAEQWALSNTGQAGGQAGADINIRPAWERIIGSPATVIAVIDSGIDFTHPELIDNQWTNNREIEGNSLDDDQNGLIDDVHGWDWTRGDHVIRDEQGHGTSIAGIIAARGNNSEGVTGVMWRAALMSLRILDNTGTGDIATAIEAIDYAAENGAQVINASWGTAADSIFLKEAILRAGTRGVVFVCSAGNSARDLDSEAYYPAAYDLLNLISVASTDGADQLATFSNWGAERVSIAAPGVNILTTQMGGGYRTVSGTSASAPLVAGIAGLVKSLSPGIVSSVAVAAIRDGVRVVPQLDNRVRTRGVANAAGALAAMSTANAPVPTPPPGGWTPAPTPPPATPGAPEGLPSLDEVLSTPVPPPGAPAQQVTANLRCLDCDPSGEPGGGYIPPGDTYYGRARLEPKNETGQPGVDLGSRNYNWGVPLVGLPGRAGLDVAIGLYYNSLVWTRDNTGIKFDADRGQPTAGFRIGFPSIQGPYTSTTKGTAPISPIPTISATATNRATPAPTRCKSPTPTTSPFGPRTTSTPGRSSTRKMRRAWSPRPLMMTYPTASRKSRTSPAAPTHATPITRATT